MSRERQAQLFRGCAFPQSALDDAVAAQMTFPPPTAAPGQQKGTAAGQGVLDQANGASAQTGRHLAALLHQRQSPLGRFAPQEKYSSRNRFASKRETVCMT